MFRTRFERVDTKGVEFTIPSEVQQCDKDSTDINKIIKRYGEQCVCGMCAMNERQPISEEVAMLSSEDFNSMMQKMASVNNQFNELPAEVRQKFGHNPANMLEFMQDPANREEGEKLGLFEKRYNQSDFGFNGNNSVSTSVDMVGDISGKENSPAV